MFKTSDGGASWIRFNDGLTNRNVQTLALAPGASGQNILYAGTAGGGIFKSLDDGVVSDPVPVSRTFFVPVIVSAPGIGGAFYESELTLANRSSRDATVELTYTAAFGGGGGKRGRRWRPEGNGLLQTPLPISVSLAFPFPNPAAAVGPCGVRFYGLPSPDEGAVFVRTTTAVTEGRAGVAYPGLPMAFWGDTKRYTGCDRMLPIARTSRCKMLERRKTETSRCACKCLPATLPPNSPSILFHQVIPAWRVLSDQRHPALQRSENIQRLRVGQSNQRRRSLLCLCRHAQSSQPRCHLMCQPASRKSTPRLTIPTIPRRRGRIKSELVLTNSPILGRKKKVRLSFQAIEQETFQ